MNANQRISLAAAIRQFMKDISMTETPVNDEQGTVDVGTEKSPFKIHLLYARDVRFFMVSIASKYLDTSVDPLQIFTRNDPLSVVPWLDEKCFGREHMVFDADQEKWVKRKVTNPETLKNSEPSIPLLSRHLAADGSVQPGPPGKLTEEELQMAEMRKKVICTSTEAGSKIEQTYVDAESGAGDADVAAVSGSKNGTSQGTDDDDRDDKHRESNAGSHGDSGQHAANGDSGVQLQVSAEAARV